jgi:tetratricopeptide (TPR) repeat protein
MSRTLLSSPRIRVAAAALVGGGILLAANLLGSSPAYRRATDLLFSLGRYEDALATSEQAIALDPGDSLLQANRGTILAMLGRDEEALASYAHACELAPAIEPLMWMNCATTLRVLGKPAVALLFYERGLQLQPTLLQSVIILTGKGDALVELGMLIEALRAFDDALLLCDHAADEAGDLAHAELFAYLRETREKTLDSLR